MKARAARPKGLVLRSEGGGAGRTGRNGRSVAGAPRILSCRIEVTLPRDLWMASFTRTHPGLRVEVVDRLEIGRGLTMFEVHLLSTDGGGWSESIRALPGVEEVELIDPTEGSEVCRVYFQGRTFIPLLRTLRLVRHFPFPIQNGLATWTVVGPEGKVREFLRRLRTETIGVRVASVRHGPATRGRSLLTPRQQACLQRAVAEGYFDVPRRISLTKLAAQMGVAISTLSVTLAVIERKLLVPHA